MRKFIVNVNGSSYEVEVEEVDSSTAEKKQAQASKPVKSAAPASSGQKTITSPMPGTILSVNVKPGDSVKSGQVLLILEAMKMENEIMAPTDGSIVEVNVAKGATVNSGDVLVVYR